MKSLNTEITGTIDSNNICKYYKFVSTSYMLGNIVVIGNYGMKLDVTVYGFTPTGYSSVVSSSNVYVTIPHEFKTGGATVYICVRGSGGATGSFKIKVVRR